MIDFELHQDAGVLIVRPQGPLEVADFQKLSAAVDPYVESHGALRGIMICAESFPGWADFASMLAHFRFVRDHHRQVERVAAVADGGFMSIAPQIANHFVQAEVRHFPFKEMEAALSWLHEGALADAHKA